MVDFGKSRPHTEKALQAEISDESTREDSDSHSESEPGSPAWDAKATFQSSAGGEAAPQAGAKARRSVTSVAAAALLMLLHLLLSGLAVALTRLLLAVRWFLALFLHGALPQRRLERPATSCLSWDLLAGSPDPTATVREALPAPPAFPRPPEGGLTIAFGPCANLMIYTGGVAACLQRCPNWAEVAPQLRFYGASSGAFVAAVLAADQDMLELLPEMVAWTKRYRGRLWGMVGAYSASIARIARALFADPRHFQNARERLSFGVTVFSPGPRHAVLRGFQSAGELVTALLGSCYIPVAFEEPIWSPGLGPLWDGGILEFATQGDIVASPHLSCLPEVAPARAYPRALVFSAPHEADAVQLFEDGYMDCLRWLSAGAPSRRREREELTATAAGLRPLLREAWSFVAEVAPWRGEGPGCGE